MQWRCIIKWIRKYDLAEKHYKKAIYVDRNYTATYMNYGVFLFSLEKYQEACKYFEIATEDELYRNRSGAFLNYGLCMKASG